MIVNVFLLLMAKLYIDAIIEKGGGDVAFCDPDEYCI